MTQGCGDVSDMTDSHIKATEPFQKGCCTFSVVALSLFYCPLCHRCVRSDLYCGCEAVRCLLWWDSIRRGHMRTAELLCPFLGFVRFLRQKYFIFYIYIFVDLICVTLAQWCVLVILNCCIKDSCDISLWKKRVYLILSLLSLYD